MQASYRTEAVVKTLLRCRWVGFRMDMIAFGLLATASILTMACKSFIEPALLALAMTHLLQLSGSMQWAVRQTAEAENHMTSVERILGFCALPQEREGGASGGAGGGGVAKEWPGSAALEFDNVQVRCETTRFAFV